MNHMLGVDTATEHLPVLAVQVTATEHLPVLAVEVTELADGVFVGVS
uniref:Uncharacterized protein n=1 Tax=Arundo donax TaxID=35708 RepID=A0A0A9CCC4_ARUDO